MSRNLSAAFLKIRCFLKWWLLVNLTWKNPWGNMQSSKEVSEEEGAVPARKVEWWARAVWVWQHSLCHPDWQCGIKMLPWSPSLQISIKTSNAQQEALHGQGVLVNPCIPLGVLPVGQPGTSPAPRIHLHTHSKERTGAKQDQNLLRTEAEPCSHSGAAQRLEKWMLG